MRFLFVITATVVALLMVLGTVYFWGMGQIHPKYDHPFLKPKAPWLVVPVEWTLSAETSEKLGLPSDAVRWVDVHRTKTGVLVAVWPKDGCEPGVPCQNERELVSVFQGANGHFRWILNVLDNVDDIDRQMAEVLKPWLERQDFLIQSEFDVVLRATKTELPNVPYGSSQSDRMRFQTFAGMAPWSGGLLPATPFHGDAYISPLQWRAVHLIDPSIRAEMQRRQEVVVLGPLMTEQEWNTAESLAPDGYYIHQQELLPAWRKLVHPHP